VKKITRLTKPAWAISCLEESLIDKINELVDRVNEHEADEGSHITEKKRISINKIFTAESLGMKTHPGRRIR